MKSVITAVSLLALTSAGVAPGIVSAQTYGGYPPPPPPRASCQHDKTGNTVIGAVIGAGLGALLGAALAAEGHGGDGAALGAGLGGVGGGVIGSNSTNCNDNFPPPPPRPYGANDQGPNYAQSAPPPPVYGDQGYDNPPPPSGYRNDGYGGGPPPGADEFNEPPPGAQPR